MSVQDVDNFTTTIDQLVEAEPRAAARQGRPRAGSVDPWRSLDADTQFVVAAIADAARNRQLVRIRYRPKVTTGNAVYRTVAPYSLRWRFIHLNGYDAPPVRTPVFFGYDPYKGTIKMFVAARIISVERTGREFSPQWDVEFESKINKLVANLVEAEELPNDRLGRCYELAGRWLLDHSDDDDALLVHGHIYNPFEGGNYSELDHAWIVKADQVWDPTLGKWWNKEAYYQLFRVEEYATYTFEEMAKLMLQTKHWGPWLSEAVEQTSPEQQDVAVDQMLDQYEAEPTSLWLYSHLPIKDRMALAYLAADNMMGAPYEEDQVRHFAAALKMVTEPPEGFWQQVRAKDPLRADRLQSLEWSLEKVPLDRVGVWPRFGGFPKEWGTGSVVDSAEALTAGVENPERRQVVHEIAAQWATIIKFLPPILVPGGMLRPEEDYELMDWDIDDGNHRLVGAAIGGATEAVCFVGRASTQTEESKRPPHYYRKFVRVILQDASQDFSPAMQRAGGDPLDLEVTTTRLVDKGRMLGIDPEQTVEFAREMADDYAIKYSEKDDSFTIKWSDLPRSYQMAARQFAKTLKLGSGRLGEDEQDIDEITMSHAAAPYDMPMWTGPYARRKRKKRRKSDVDKAIAYLIGK